MVAEELIVPRCQMRIQPTNMAFQIDFSDVTDKTILAVILIAWCFAGMRILYGYWPWQRGPKQRNAMSCEFVSYELFPACQTNGEKTFEGVKVPRRPANHRPA